MFAAAKPVLPISIPLRFIASGIVGLLSAVSGLVWRPDLLAAYHYNQYIVALTHLFVLGWLASVVMGAMYQLVPVALETTLYSTRLARWHFILHLVGVAGMVAMFWVWNPKQVGHFGSVFGLGVLLFVYNLARTLVRVPRWNVTAVAIAASLGWLLLTMLAGLFLAATKCWPITWFSPLAQMHAHAHLGVLGFFVMMLVGVTYKLIPMFTLSEVQSKRRAQWSIALLNIGLAGLVPSIALASGWKSVFALVIAIGLALYLLELWAIVRERKRRSLDWGIKYFLTAVGLLGPVCSLGMILSWRTLPLTGFTGQLENVYGFLVLVGVLTLSILGMLYKIVPFLVWYDRYSSKIGRSKVPTLAELYSPHGQAWSFWLFLGGLLGASAATAAGHESALRAGCLLLASGLVAFALNLGKILLHLVRPKIEPILIQGQAAPVGLPLSNSPDPLPL
jgi:cbb3-type cytochrome oxidase subunit 1